MSTLAPDIPPKHKCDPASPCPIFLSDIGRRFHTFPKGTFRARYIPPSPPPYVQRYLAASFPTWTWTTRAGPNEGKSFKVPSLPTACPKGSPRALRWLADLFHSFKAHLQPSILIDGKVPTPISRLYQSNMIWHLRSHAQATPTIPAPPPSQPVPPPSSRRVVRDTILRSPASSPPSRPITSDSPFDFIPMQQHLPVLFNHISGMSLPQQSTVLDLIATLYRNITGEQIQPVPSVAPPSEAPVSHPPSVASAKRAKPHTPTSPPPASKRTRGRGRGRGAHITDHFAPRATPS